MATFKKIGMILDNLMNRDTEAEDSLLKLPYLLKKLVDEARKPRRPGIGEPNLMNYDIIFSPSFKRGGISRGELMIYFTNHKNIRTN